MTEGIVEQGIGKRIIITQTCIGVKFSIWCYQILSLRDDISIVITQFDKRKTLNKSVAELVKDSFCDKVFKTVIRDNVALAEAPINLQGMSH